jgi:hypothetical protein
MIADTTRNADASTARATYRYQERRRRTWCWSRPHTPVTIGGDGKVTLVVFVAH